MQVKVTGKHTEVGESFTRYMENALGDIIKKYFPNPVDSQVIVEKKGHHFFIDIIANIHHGFDVASHGQDSDPYTAFDMAVSRLRSRISRHKNRLKDHHSKEKTIQIDMAQKYVLDGFTDQETETHPSIVAEMEMEIPTISVGDAVMRMELKDMPLYIFKNIQNNQTNVIFRRKDGNIGWVDPSNLTSK